ncbi:MAG: hypothetical protein LUD72_04865 [Bacteroidales bacterium]|nr:hypothetical protein [Bacteroidales bacterium]
MPKFELSNQPKYPVVTMDTDSPVDENALAGLLADREGVTLLIRPGTGHPKRGGYFFCLSKKSDGTYDLETIESVFVKNFHLRELTRFVNHCSGLKFDGEMFRLCQDSINFKNDE